MTNNILKEIKNELISKGREPNIDNLEQYISQNKIFSIFFISKIIPDISTILYTLNNLYMKNDSMKLIICICSDTKEDFEETLLLINKDISCLILNYESKNRELLISKYNIINIPSLIILDKDGKLIDSLNIEKIKSLTEYELQGWENLSKINNIYKKKKPELGEIVLLLSVHRHELIYSDNIMKAYGKSGWSCDVCRKHYEHYISNFFCPLCGWDLCDPCYVRFKEG